MLLVTPERRNVVDLFIHHDNILRKEEILAEEGIEKKFGPSKTEQKAIDRKIVEKKQKEAEKRSKKCEELKAKESR